MSTVAKEYSVTWEVLSDEGWIPSRRTHQHLEAAELHRESLLAPDMASHVRNVGQIEVRTIFISVGDWEALQ